MNKLSLLNGNPAVKFVLKGLLVYIIWYIIYNLIINPAGYVDAWLEHNLVVVSGDLLHLLGYSVFYYKNVLGINHLSGIEVSAGCNGLSAIGLFLGFVIAYPGDTLKRWLFIPFGCLLIYISNIIRISILALTQHYKPDLFDFMHHYSLPLFFYLVIFVMWMVWANWGQYKIDRNIKLAVISNDQD